MRGGPGEVFRRTRPGPGKTAASRSSARMRCMRRRHAPAVRKPQDGQRARRIPAPARGEHGRIEQRLREHVLDGFGPQKLEHDFERKGMLLAERNHDAVVGGRRLQFEIERAAEALAQRQAPGAIDARAERRVQDELHAAAFVEEALRHHVQGRGKAPSARAAGQHIRDGLLRAEAIESAFALQPVGLRSRQDILAQPRDFAR